jgi:hypothetical protein
MLPFDKLNPTDRVIIDSLKAQNDSLREQSKILHTISDEIFKNRRSSSNKENKDIQREVFKLGSGISEIKSYLAGKGKGSFGSSFGGKAQPDKGFFTNLFSKVFGPSKYQQKMMEEMSALRDITERQARNIDFIARQSTDSKRAIEREKLAEAIARRMSGLDMGGGASGGMLSGLGKILLAGIVGAISLLSSTLMSGFKGLLNGFDKLVDGITKLSRLFPTIPGMPGANFPGGQKPGGQPPVVLPPDGKNPSGGGTRPTTRPGGNRLLLEGPGRGAPFDPNYKSRFPWNEGKYGPRVVDAENVRTGRPSRFSPGGAGRGLAGALAALGLTMLLPDDPDATIEDIVKGGLPNKGARNTSRLFGSPYSPSNRSLFGNMPGPFNASRDLAPGETYDVRGTMGDIRYLDSPLGDGTKWTEGQYARWVKSQGGMINGQKLTEGQMAKLDEAEQREKDIIAQKNEEAKLRQEYDELQNQGAFNKLLKEANEALEKFSDNLDFLSKEDIEKKIVPFLDQLGEITIQDQKINLAPGLGTALAKTIEDTTKLSEELIDYTKEKFSGTVNNVTNNILGQGDSGKNSTTVTPNSSTSENTNENFKDFVRRYGSIYRY